MARCSSVRLKRARLMGSSPRAGLVDNLRTVGVLRQRDASPWHGTRTLVRDRRSSGGIAGVRAALHLEWPQMDRAAGASLWLEEGAHALLLTGNTARPLGSLFRLPRRPEIAHINRRDLAAQRSPICAKQERPWPRVRRGHMNAAR